MNAVPVWQLYDVALSGGTSLRQELPRRWGVWGLDGGGWLLAGGADQDRPEVSITVEISGWLSSGRDLAEPLAWLLGEVLARFVRGSVECGDVATLMRMLDEAARGG